MPHLHTPIFPSQWGQTTNAEKPCKGAAYAGKTLSTSVTHVTDASPYDNGDFIIL
jgi:hypothetical protein